MLVHKKGSSRLTMKKLIIHNKSYTDKAITHRLKNDYINAGYNLADRLPHTDKNQTQYIAHSFQSSFTGRGIQEVYDAIMVLNLLR